ncbi:MAG: hypothetical protein SV375_12180 [Thermodesulfobacteriota bacterium]|nr:hypothetical protein [Thermodesulfobacteriota bacterium]
MDRVLNFIFVFAIIFSFDVHAESVSDKLPQDVGSKYTIEAPRSKLRGIFDRKELCHFQIRSLTPQQATGNALAFAVQMPELLIFPEHIYKLKVNEQTKIDIPSEWLVPREEFIEDKNHYVSSFNYPEDVEWFKVDGFRLTGLHFSSYESMPPGSGSAMPASGRDVFLIIDIVKGNLVPALITLGETKGRVRSSGCFFAKNCHFFICDIDQDGYVDIGIAREEISCDYDTIEKNGIETDVVSGPHYRIFPRQWYTFDHRQQKWIHNPSFDNRLCRNERRLRYIEIHDHSPVDDVIIFASTSRYIEGELSKWKNMRNIFKRL